MTEYSGLDYDNCHDGQCDLVLAGVKGGKDKHIARIPADLAREVVTIHFMAFQEISSQMRELQLLAEDCENASFRRKVFDITDRIIDNYFRPVPAYWRLPANVEAASLEDFDFGLVADGGKSHG